jgi:hypothetical protein
MNGVISYLTFQLPPLPWTVMTRFMRVIHVFLRGFGKDVDGPDKPGHDD